jgi:protein required for attachment to host cells
MITWILVANAAEAKLLTSENLRIVGELKLLRELTHPNSRKKAADLMSDKPGHYKTDGGMRGAYSKNDPKEVEAEHFAIHLAHELKAGWDQNQYKHLVIVTPAHFYGLLGKHLDNHLSDIVHISKDYTRYPLLKLADSLKEYLFV